MNILKFKPIFKERIWGGRLLADRLGKRLPADKMIGESWELSGVPGDVSVVSSGQLKGNTLQELIEVYMGDLVGEQIYETFGDEFPLLIKFIDAHQDLSIQVHPDDILAETRHHSYGKNEMWYVLDHTPDAHLYLGFNQAVDRQKCVEHIEDGKIEQLLRSYVVKRADSFFIPAGTIHAIGSGILVAEIQQTSDITYRLFDFNRVDSEGKPRDLHIALALDAIDYSSAKNCDITRKPVADECINLISCQYFATDIIEVRSRVVRDYSTLDSFVVYICVDGKLTLTTSEGVETISKGETALVPAAIDSVTIEGVGKIIETYIPV